MTLHGKLLGILAATLPLVLLREMAHALGSAPDAPSTTGQDAVAYQMTPGHTGASTDPVGPQWTSS